MTKETEFDPDEMMEREIVKILEGIKDMYTPTYPKLDHAPLALYNEKDYLGQPLLFIKDISDYYFISYFVKQVDSGDLVLGTARKPSAKGWKYITRIEGFTRLIESMSLCVRSSCSVPAEMPDFLRNLPMGSFLQIDLAEGVQALGIYRGFESGKLHLAFGFDQDTGQYEDLSEVDFRKRDMGQEARPVTMKTEFELDECRRISLLQLTEGISGIDGIPDNRQGRLVSDHLLCKLVSGPFSSMNIEFDRFRLTTSFRIGEKLVEGPCYSSFAAHPTMSGLKIFAGLDQAEDYDSQEGSFTFETNNDATDKT